MTSAKQLIQKLPLISENILVEAAQQPSLFVEAAEYRVSIMRLRSQALTEYENWCSKLALHYRKSKTKGERVTEGAIKDHVRINRNTRVLDIKLQRAFAHEEFSKLLLEAFRMRRDAIRVIAEAYNIEGIRGSAQVEKIEAHRKLVKKAQDLESRRQRVED